mgnify:FL=1
MVMFRSMQPLNMGMVESLLMAIHTRGVHLLHLVPGLEEENFIPLQHIKRAENTEDYVEIIRDHAQ